MSGLLSQEKFSAENYWNMPSERVIPPEEYGPFGYRQQDFLKQVRDNPNTMDPQDFGFDGTPEQAGALRVAAAYMLDEDQARNFRALEATDLTAQEYLEQRQTMEDVQTSVYDELKEGVSIDTWLDIDEQEKHAVLKPVAAQLKQRAGRIGLQQVLWEKQHGLLAPSVLDMPTIEGYVEHPIDTAARERAKHHVLRMASKLLKNHPNGISAEDFTQLPAKHDLFNVIGASNAISHLTSIGAVERSQDGSIITPTELITNPRQSSQMQYVRRVDQRFMNLTDQKRAA